MGSAYDVFGRSSVVVSSAGRRLDNNNNSFGRCSLVGSGWVESDRVWSGRIESDMVGSGRVEKGRIKSDYGVAGMKK